jgi:hypothetical protein
VGRTFIEVLPLALGGAISPVVLLVQLATLASRSHPVGRSLIVLGANALVVAVVIVVVVVGDHRTAMGATPTGTGDVVGAWIRIVLAVLLAATAVRLLVVGDKGAKGSDPAEPTPDAAEEPLRPLRFFLLGVGAMASNATTLVLLIPAIHTVATAGLRGGQELSLFVSISAIVLLPSYLPLLGLGALGKRGPATLDALSTWLRHHNRDVQIVVSLGFAVFLGWTGFTALG